MAAAVAASAALLAAASAGSAPGDALPDLVSDPPSGEYLQAYADGGGTRLLLRFNGFVHNDGAGPLEIRGTGNAAGLMTTVQQRVYGAGGGTSRDVATGGTIRYETADGHGHFHLHSAMEYALFDGSRSGPVAPGMKVGFCLLDSERVSGAAQKAYANESNCEQGRPFAAQVVMGLSPGWRDVYGSTLAFQWVDVSDVAPGSYWLAARSDPDQVMLEEDETDNGWAFNDSPSIVPGYVARPLTLTAATTGATPLDLIAFRHGQPGPVRWQIVTAPREGSLDRAVGEVFDGSRVNYVPRSGFSGVDTFEVAARDSTSGFPLHAPAATVTIAVNGTTAPSVTISGAPDRLVAGTAVQLTATVTGGPQSVTWSVDGVQGGTAAAGTITSGGLYTAPAAVPAAGRVTIRAASASAAAQVSIGIDAATPPAPAPAPAIPPAPPAPAATPAPPVAVTPAPAPAAPTSGVGGTKLVKLNPLSVPTLSARGRFLLVGLSTSRAGSVKVNVLRNGKRLGGCLVKASAARSLTCSVPLGRRVALRGLAIRIALRVNGRVVAARSARVAAVSAKSADGIRTLYCTLG